MILETFNLYLATTAAFHATQLSKRQLRSITASDLCSEGPLTC